MARHCSRSKGQQDGTLDRHHSAGRHKSRRQEAGADRQILGSGTRTEEALESRNYSDPDSGRCSESSAQGPEEEL